MALVLKDRVRESTTTTGTGTITLGGAVTGFQSFSAIGNANTTYYCIAGQGTSEWEVGIGTYTASGTTLSRDTILASSNSGSAVNFSAGTKDVFVTYPAGKSVNQDASGNVTITGTTTATNSFIGAAGSASQMTYGVTGYSNHGIWWDTGGVMKFEFGGSGTVAALSASTGLSVTGAVTTTGNVGIGTSSPGGKLHAVVTDASTVLKLERTGAGAASYTADFSGATFNQSISAGADFVWIEGGTEWMRLTNTGNVGIGTASPGTTVDIVGANKTNGNEQGILTVRSSDAFAIDKGGSVSFYGKYNTAGGYASFGRIYGAKENSTDGNFLGYLGFATSPNGAPTERMRIDSSGNVGIGTSSGSTFGVFTVNTSSSSNTPIVAITANSLSPQLNHYITDSGSTVRNLNQICFNTGSSSSANYQGFMTFSTMASAGGTITERMRIDSSGNMGIGATSMGATQRLLVKYVPTADFTAITNTAYNHLTVQGNNAGYAGITIASPNTGAQTGGLAFADTASGIVGLIGYDHSGNSMYFFTNDAERMRIDSSGNVLVGTTDSSGTSGVGTKQITSSTVPLFSTVINDSAGSNYYLLYNTNATNNGYRFYVNSNGGISNYSGNNVNLSDKREKKEFAPAKNYLDIICAIPVQTFRFIDQIDSDFETTLGVVAQDVQSVAPELVTESNWGSEENPKIRLSIYQTDFQYALMKCIQELKENLDATNAELAALKNMQG